MCSLTEYELEEVETIVLKDQKTLLDLPDPCTACFNVFLKEFLKSCWEYDASDRPNFQSINLQIQEIKKKDCSHLPCFPYAWVKEEKVSVTGQEISYSSIKLEKAYINGFSRDAVSLRIINPSDHEEVYETRKNDSKFSYSRFA